MRRATAIAWVLAAAVTGSACGDDDGVDRDAPVVVDDAGYGAGATAPFADGDTTGGAMRTGQTGGQGAMELEVSIAARELRVYRDGQVVETHPVAVGSSEWPTPTGEWTVGQVIWNPRWVPPAEEWAKDEEEQEPGDPENPLGRAQLVYRSPNSIHGTNAPESLGQAVSHGSIRVSNEVALRLARMAAEAGGAARDEAWYQRAESNRTQRQELSLPNPIPIRVIAGR